MAAATATGGGREFVGAAAAAPFGGRPLPLL